MNSVTASEDTVTRTFISTRERFAEIVEAGVNAVDRRIYHELWQEHPFPDDGLASLATVSRVHQGRR